PRPTAEARRRARASFGLRASDRVVCGVFRLAAEKQPLLFLDVIREACSRVCMPNLKVLLAGTGDLEQQVADAVEAEGLKGCVHLLGRRTDVGNILLASDVSLLTSTLEGCPNIALESQYLGVPIVATAGGGTADAVAHGVTGFLAGVDDTAALADYLVDVLRDDALRADLAAAGPGFVGRQFDLE